MEAADKCLEVPRSSINQLLTEIYGLPLYAYAEGNIALAQGDFEKAIKSIESGIQFLQSKKITYILPLLLQIRGQALWAMGRIEEATSALEDGSLVADGMDSRMELWPVLATLVKLKEESGAVKEAAELRAQGQNVIRFISNNIGDPLLRQRFLDLPEVQLLQEQVRTN